MRLTIIVTVYNEVRTVKQAIDDVRSLDIEKEIIVIDNCSTDGTKEILKGFNDDDIKIIYQDKNYGYGKSIERGVSLANGEYIFVQFNRLNKIKKQLNPFLFCTSAMDDMFSYRACRLFLR